MEYGHSTSRRNLDPFAKYEDQRLWDSLRAVSLDAAVEDMQA